MQIKGDVDNDGRLTIIDMLLIFMYNSGEIPKNEFSAEELKRADVNNDGNVALADALLIAKHLRGEELIDEVI